ncbi:MAG: hypothetical protein KBD29_00295 [Candidatus Magasanikbacteria bacterium]|nr:hypothetical protein [Candidatus Magasanikbacteria bacterium]
MDQEQISTLQVPKMGLWIGLSILITAIAVGGGVYVWQQNILHNYQQNLQAQIDTLNGRIDAQKNEPGTVLSLDTDLSSTSTSVTQNTEKNVPEEEMIWKTYSNETIKVSFSYPPEFTITRDKLLMKYQNNSFSYGVTLENKQAPEQPIIMLEFNPAGYGTAPDKIYTVSETDTGMLKIDSVTKQTPNEMNSDGKVGIDIQLTSKNGNLYEWHFMYAENGKDYEELFQKILGTFKLSM